jgi:putative endopeptidase
MSSSHKIRSLSVGAAVLMALASCQKAPEQKAEAAPAFKLDESALIQPIRFTRRPRRQQGRLHRLGGYVNGKWLAANRFRATAPAGARSKCSTSARCRAAPAGRAGRGDEERHRRREDRRRLLGHRHGRSQDQRQGIAPLKADLAEIDALADGAAMADYLRSPPPRARGFLFGFGPRRTSRTRR